ncbi:hypothetical protein DICA0_D16336 [Diutina catenulata]
MTAVNEVRIDRTPLSPKRGHRLGTATASWSKIKQVTNGGDDADTLAGDANDTLVDCGPHGELFVLYPEQSQGEIWDWDGSQLCLVHRLDIASAKKSARTSAASAPTSDASSHHPITHMRLTADLSLVVARSSRLEVHHIYSDSNTSELVAEADVGNEVVELAVSDHYIVAGDEVGLVHVMNAKLEPVHSVTTSMTKHNVPVFAVHGAWLAYSPARAEHVKLRSEAKSNAKGEANAVGAANAANGSREPKLNSARASESKSNAARAGEATSNTTGTNRFATDANRFANTRFTPLKMPPRGPLLARVLSSFSKSALDGLVRLSAASSKRLKRAVAEGTSADYRASSISRSVGRLLYQTAASTASSLQKTAENMQPGDCQLVKVVDLASGHTLAVFKPPGGVSHLSLSPHDLHLLSVSARGDAYYMWDLYRLPREVALVGKFTRGKTSAVVTRVFWMLNPSARGATNGGFGTITRASGTVHWFNTNYLWGSHSNRPVGCGADPAAAAAFVDDWIIPRANARALVSIPAPVSAHASSASANLLAVLDRENRLKVVSTLNGAHSFQYDLPTKVPEDPRFDGANLSRASPSPTPTGADPMAEAEIDTCFAFLNLVNNNNVAFAVFDEAAPLWGSSDVTVVKPFAEPVPPRVGSVAEIDLLDGVVIEPDSVECLEERVQAPS